MKYIKTFEEINLKYNIGDYVILDLAKIKKDIDKLNSDKGLDIKVQIENIVKIIRFRELSKTLLYYQIEFYFGQDDDFYLIRDEDIVREATTEEIDDFKEKKELNNKIDKFNI